MFRRPKTVKLKVELEESAADRHRHALFCWQDRMSTHSKYLASVADRLHSLERLSERTPSYAAARSALMSMLDDACAVLVKIHGEEPRS